MKKAFTCAAIAIITLAVFNSCKKKSGLPYFMKATTGATTYYASHCNISETSGAHAGLFIVSTTSSNYFTTTFPYIAITIPTWSADTGTFIFDSTMLHNYAQYFTADSTYKLSSSGSVVITKVGSTTLSGTFSFTCTDGFTVSGGSFVGQR